MNYHTFFSRIKAGDIQGVFLFHGAEEFVKRSALTQLKESIDPAVRDLNVQEMKSPLANAVIETGETLPFFAERRLVICHEMADAELKSLLEKIDHLPETTTLILYVRGNCKKDVLQLVSADRVVEFAELSEQDAYRFVEKRARLFEVSMTPVVIRLLVDMVGTEAHALKNEITKAAEYAGRGNAVTEEILRACVTPNLEYEFFGMFDQLLYGHKEKAMLALRHMLRNDAGSAFLLAHSFERQCKQMLAARLSLDAGVKERDIPHKLNLKPTPARTAVCGAKKFNAARLRAATIDFAAVDYLQVSGKMPADRALEIAVLRHF